MKKLLAGTIARGIMWASAGLAAKVGSEAVMSEDTSIAAGGFAAALIMAAIAMLWSKKKDKPLIK